MRLVTFIFSTELNSSVQVGDILYYVPVGMPGTANNSFQVGDISNVIRFGQITSILSTSISVLWDDSDNSGNGVPDIPLPTSSDFIMFGKDPVVNESAIKGYYADVVFRNDSTRKIELFSISTEIVESSK